MKKLGMILFLGAFCLCGGAARAAVFVISSDPETEADNRRAEKKYLLEQGRLAQEQKIQDSKNTCSNQFDTDKCREALVKIAEAKEKENTAEQYLAQALEYERKSFISRRRGRVDLFRVFTRNASDAVDSARRLKAEAAEELETAQKMHEESTAFDVRADEAKRAKTEAEKEVRAAKEKTLREKELKDMDSSQMIQIGQH
ncbi:MAG: hypothetical protein PHW69_01885 [Elusimicrobiaceae bacterium]|nr:hypothetical protein [Elusimicrobiaceae bacterium]